MLRVTGLQKGFGGQRLFRDADWFVGRDERVALVGPNGSGKSTLLKIVAGLEGADGGTIELPKSVRVGYLAQCGFVLGAGSVREEAREAFREVLALQDELHAVERELARPHHGPEALSDLTVRQAELHERLAILGAHEIERQVHAVLLGLGFRESDFDRPVRTLSGGWQMRAALARTLLQRPQLLLLDEPTNHLDLEAREWLEGYLQGYPYAFVLVSHDRYFLDQTIRRVAELVEFRLENYAGNFTFFEQEREKRYELRQKAYDEQQREIRHIQRFIDKNRADNKRAPQVQSRIRMLEKMERLTPPVPPRRSIAIRYPECVASGKVVLELRHVRKAYGDQVVFADASLKILRRARVALVGPNGAGKSTLMRLLAGREAPDAGERILGFHAEVAFFAQDEGSRFDPGASVYESVLEAAPTAFVPQVRGLLGAFLFSGDAVEKRVAALSGGELNRLAIAALLVRPSNLLLLDEPTNHLDLAAKDALLDSLRAYAGTIVFVSHDRHFLDGLATHVIEVGGGGLYEYPGTYPSFLWHRRHSPGERAGAASAVATPEAAAPAAPSPVGAATPPARGARGRGPSRLQKIESLERSIADLEGRKQRFAKVLSDPALFADRDKGDFYLREYQEAEGQLARLYAQWEKLHAEAGEAD